MRSFFDRKTFIIYVMILVVFIFIPLYGNRIVTTLAETQIKHNYVVIDAGHGGVDGGAISCTGAHESNINLEIAIKTNDLMHLLGIRTVMIRETDRSIYTNGETIAAKKVSDIKQRVRIVNSTPNAILLSIHQNNFQDSRYSGAQVFYNAHTVSRDLAEKMQSSFRDNLNPMNKRPIKRSSGVYLMEHTNCPGILVECGFLSNPTEEANLRNNEYQKKICCIIGTTISQYLNT